MILLHLSLAWAASWEADTAAAVAGPDAAERLAALQTALLAASDGDHRARLRDLLQALDRLAPLPTAERVAVAERILAGERVALAEPPPPPPEPWAETLLQQLGVAPSTEAAVLLLAAARQGPAGAADRLDILEGLVDAVAPLDAARSARARPLYAEALSPDPVVRARVDAIVRRTLAGELRLVQLGLAPAGRVRADFDPTVIDGWWYACNTYSNHNEWRWSLERPDVEACGQAGVAARRRGWTIAVGGEAVEREDALGELTTLGKRHGCLTDVVLRREGASPHPMASGVSHDQPGFRYPTSADHPWRVLGTGPGRPQDCREREATEREVAEAAEALAAALGGGEAPGATPP